MRWDKQAAAGGKSSRERAIGHGIQRAATGKKQYGEIQILDQPVAMQ